MGNLYFCNFLIFYYSVWLQKGFESAGRVGLTMVFGGVIGSVVWGIVLDKTHKYK